MRGQILWREEHLAPIALPVSAIAMILVRFDFELRDFDTAPSACPWTQQALILVLLKDSLRESYIAEAADYLPCGTHFDMRREVL